MTPDDDDDDSGAGDDEDNETSYTKDIKSGSLGNNAHNVNAVVLNGTNGTCKSSSCKNELFPCRPCLHRVETLVVFNQSI